jgi:hypothetical protein
MYFLESMSCGFFLYDEGTVVAPKQPKAKKRQTSGPDTASSSSLKAAMTLDDSLPRQQTVLS